MDIHPKKLLEKIGSPQDPDIEGSAHPATAEKAQVVQGPRLQRSSLLPRKQNCLERDYLCSTAKQTTPKLTIVATVLWNVSTWHQEKELFITHNWLYNFSVVIGWPQSWHHSAEVFHHGSSKEAPSPHAIGCLQMRCPSQSYRAEKDHKRGTLQEKKFLNSLEVKLRQVCLKFYHSFKGKKQKWHSTSSLPAGNSHHIFNPAVVGFWGPVLESGSEIGFNVSSSEKLTKENSSATTWTESRPWNVGQNMFMYKTEKKSSWILVLDAHMYQISKG